MTPATREERSAPCQVVCGGVRWKIAPEFREVLLGPDGLRLDEWLAAGQARIVKHGPHRTVYRVVLPEIDCHVKHCRLQDGRAWLRECFRPAKARGEYERCRAVAQRGLATVVPLAVGESCGGPGESYLITRTLDAEPLGPFLQQTLPALAPERRTHRRQRLAVALARFLERMHTAGIRHNDLHTGNLLLSLGPDDEHHLHLIDLHAVRLGRPLGWAARRDSLVMLNRWFSLRAGRADRLRFWKAYCAAYLQSSARRDEAALARELEEWTTQSNLRFWARRDRRCLVNNRYYRVVRSATAAGHAVSDFDQATIDALLADPDEPFRRPGVFLLKDSRSSTVAEFDLPINGRPRRVIYKRFRVTTWTDPLTALVRPTPALRSWVHGHGLRERCLPTPQPLLVLHRRRLGLSFEGYLLTEKVTESQVLAQYVALLGSLPEAKRRPPWRDLIERLAHLVRDLHSRHISQRDLKAANILVQPTDAGPVLSLIDLVGITVHRRLSQARRVQNLARLHVSFHADPRLTRSDRLRFLRTYLAWGLYGKEEWKDWWRKIEVATARKAARNIRNGRVLC